MSMTREECVAALKAVILSEEVLRAAISIIEGDEAALESASYLIAFIRAEKDMDICETCTSKACCSCCSKQATITEQVIAQRREG